MNGCDVVTVVGGGHSAAKVDLEKLAGHVIAVNDAALHLPRWNTLVSMDRLWCENRLPEVARQLNQLPGTLRNARAIYCRSNALQNIRPLALGFPREIVPFDCDHETDTFTDAELARQGDVLRLNGRNSGACALNLAFHFAPRRLFLVGFDMNKARDGRAYWYPPYPWTGGREGSGARKYSEWAAGFAYMSTAFGLIGCEVFNVSPASAITAFPKITPAAYLEMNP